MDMNLSKLRETVKDREAWRATAMGLQKVGHDLVTEQQKRCFVLIQSNFSHKGTLAMSESIFDGHDRGGGVLFNGKGCN